MTEIIPEKATQHGKEGSLVVHDISKESIANLAENDLENNDVDEFSEIDLDSIAEDFDPDPEKLMNLCIPLIIYSIGLYFPVFSTITTASFMQTFYTTDFGVPAYFLTVTNALVYTISFYTSIYFGNQGQTDNKKIESDEDAVDESEHVKMSSEQGFLEIIRSKVTSCWTYTYLDGSIIISAWLSSIGFLFYFNPPHGGNIRSWYLFTSLIYNLPYQFYFIIIQAWLYTFVQKTSHTTLFLTGSTIALLFGFITASLCSPYFSDKSMGAFSTFGSILCIILAGSTFFSIMYLSKASTKRHVQKEEHIQTTILSHSRRGSDLSSHRTGQENDKKKSDTDDIVVDIKKEKQSSHSVTSSSGSLKTLKHRKRGSDKDLHLVDDVTNKEKEMKEIELAMIQTIDVSSGQKKSSVSTEDIEKRLHSGNLEGAPQTGLELANNDVIEFQQELANKLQNVKQESSISTLNRETNKLEIGVISSCRSAFNNFPFVIISAVSVISGCYFGIYTQLLRWFMLCVFDVDVNTGILYFGYNNLSQGIAGAFGVLITTPLVHVLGPKLTAIVATFLCLLGQVLGLLLLLYDRSSNGLFYYVVLSTPPTFFGFGILNIVVKVMVGMCIDFDELKNYRRREGIFSAIFNVLAKVMQTVMSTAALALLEVLEFQAGDVDKGEFPAQKPKVKTYLIGIVQGLPILLYLACIVCIYLFPITRKEHEDILQTISLRGDENGRYSPRASIIINSEKKLGETSPKHSFKKKSSNGFLETLDNEKLPAIVKMIHKIEEAKSPSGNTNTSNNNPPGDYVEKDSNNVKETASVISSQNKERIEDEVNDLTHSKRLSNTSVESGILHLSESKEYFYLTFSPEEMLYLIRGEVNKVVKWFILDTSILVICFIIMVIATFTCLRRQQHGSASLYVVADVIQSLVIAYQLARIVPIRRLMKYSLTGDLTSTAALSCEKRSIDWENQSEARRIIVRGIVFRITAYFYCIVIIFISFYTMLFFMKQELTDESLNNTGNSVLTVHSSFVALPEFGEGKQTSYSMMRTFNSLGYHRSLRDTTTNIVGNAVRFAFGN